MKSITHWHFSCRWAVLTLNQVSHTLPVQVHKTAGHSIARKGDLSQSKGHSSPRAPCSPHTLAGLSGRIRDGLGIGQQVVSSCSPWCLFTIATFFLQFVLLLLLFYCFLGPFLLFFLLSLLEILALYSVFKILLTILLSSHEFDFIFSSSSHL